MAEPVRNPYPGLASFTEDDSECFFGRDKEAQDLTWLLAGRRVVLLYGPSGAGKSSLLQAKLIPGLRVSQNMRLLLARVSELSADLLPGVADRLCPTPVAATGTGESADTPCLLVIDQFEEIFTLHADDTGVQQAFFAQLKACLDKHPGLGLLLSLREDYLADLEGFARYLPDRLRTRMRLDRLSASQAEEAIAKPAARAGKPFAEGVARSLANELCRSQTTRRANGAASAANDPGQRVEPVQLQIVCRQLWEKLPANATEIALKPGQVATVDEVLTDYYRDALAAVRLAFPDQSERMLREWFTAGLITPARTRGTVFEGDSSTGTLQNGAVSILESLHIVRKEDRPTGKWVELAHDRLVEPILTDNLKWLADYRNPVAEAMRGDAGALLSEQAIAGAERFEREHPGELNHDEIQFLSDSVKAQKAAKRWRRTRNLLGFVILAGAIAWLQQDALRARYIWYQVMKAPLFGAVGGSDAKGFADCASGCPFMVRLEPGKFQMGAAVAAVHEPKSEPVHDVRIPKAFAVSKTEITFGQWNACVFARGCQTPLPASWLDPDGKKRWEDPQQPVVSIGWRAAEGYTIWLSRISGHRYRLLSEAEWEYAARAGSADDGVTDETQLRRLAWYNANADGASHTAGTLQPNAFGLFDMNGNVAEWVQDYLHGDYTGAPSDGSAWDKEIEGPNEDYTRRIVRGGSFRDGPPGVSPVSRDAGTADGRGYPHVGFRVAREL